MINFNEKWTSGSWIQLSVFNNCYCSRLQGPPTLVDGKIPAATEGIDDSSEIVCGSDGKTYSNKYVGAPRGPLHEGRSTQGS